MELLNSLAQAGSVVTHVLILMIAVAFAASIAVRLTVAALQQRALKVRALNSVSAARRRALAVRARHWH